MALSNRALPDPASSAPHPTDTNRATLAAYFALSLAHMLWETAPFFRNAAPTVAATHAFSFHVMAWLGYSALYVALSLLPALIAARFSQRHWPQLLAVIGSVIALLLVRTDRSVFDLYNFHINGFVLNLVLTPGGIDSLGGGSESYISVGLLVARIIALQCIFLWTARALGTWFGRSTRRAAWGVFALLFVSTQVSYGIGDLRNDGAILDTADNYPLFLRVRFRGLAIALGFPPITRAHASTVAKVDSSRLQYPLQPMRYDGSTRPLNIVWLVAESLRWDQLTPDIMPNTWALARRGQHFLNHYSSGNGTREGLFGMFYGLYGSYWDNFLHAGRGPLLIDRMQSLNYQMELRTSARFTYPEFNKTLFIKVPPQFMHEDEFKESAWERDRDNTSALLGFIEKNKEAGKRDATHPFLTFMFFESTHARYTFPDEAIIRRPYLEKVDYTEMSREKLASYANQLRNRYSNAAHWVDVQVGRIVDDLDRQQLLDNTVIIVTGDHGEEFMEKGFWGHNSSFVEEQTHTPLVVWMPGMVPHTIERTTSHMDIAVTLMQMLGASNDVSDYALGRNLFDDDSAHPRDFITISDWHSVGIKAADFKYRVPYTSRGMENYKPTHSDDSAFSDSEAERDVLARHQQIILAAVRNITRFAK
ncbi:MAG TPA: sulfatase-like hydrolase/transferase [Spongiibacteraceae bacterium]|nr:sulfatase-like hydrolase/transferase [Spongiibacteraceae bacterium]